jgi:ketosteroid isomerase-like protein
MTAVRDLLTRFHAAMRERSADDLAALYAADAVHEFPFLSPGLPSAFHGREEIRERYHRAWDATPVRPTEVRVDAVHETADPSVLVAEHVVFGTLATTGEPIAVPGLLVLQEDGGELIRVRDYMDTFAVMSALGGAPSLGT